MEIVIFGVGKVMGSWEEQWFGKGQRGVFERDCGRGWSGDVRNNGVCIMIIELICCRCSDE